MIFNESHHEFFDGFKKLYLDNTESFIKLQDEIVRKGNDQTPINYWLQINNIELNLDLPVAFNLTHLHRKEMLIHNWQLNDDRIPFFIKYGYMWRLTGIPKDQRSQLSNQIWDMIRVNYE